MRVGVPTEIKNNENRVALTPAGVHELVRRGHEVVIQAGAGLGSRITDEEFIAAGAGILSETDAVTFVRGGSTHWSQDEGLALMLAIDRLNPLWSASAFGPDASTAEEMAIQASRQMPR